MVVASAVTRSLRRLRPGRGQRPERPEPLAGLDVHRSDGPPRPGRPGSATGSRPYGTSLVGLLGRDDHVGKSPTGRAVGDREEGGQCPASRAAKSAVGRPRAALMRDADDHAAALWSQRCFESLTASTCAGRPIRRSASQDERAPPSHRARSCHSRRRGSATPRCRPHAVGSPGPPPATRAAPAVQDPFGEGGLGGHHRSSRTAGHHASAASDSSQGSGPQAAEHSDRRRQGSGRASCPPSDESGRTAGCGLGTPESWSTP